jgi:hypothetical protein
LAVTFGELTGFGQPSNRMGQLVQIPQSRSGPTLGGNGWMRLTQHLESEGPLASPIIDPQQHVDLG